TSTASARTPGSAPWRTASAGGRRRARRSSRPCLSAGSAPGARGVRLNFFLPGSKRAHSRPGSALQDLLEEREGAGVVRLAEPEDRLVADGGIAVLAGGVDEQRHALVFRELAEGEHRLLLHLGLGVVLDGAGDHARHPASRALGQPEEGLAAHVAA